MSRAKRKQREFDRSFKEKFTEQAAEMRDLDKERQVLEK
mgnify:FL=1